MRLVNFFGLLGSLLLTINVFGHVDLETKLTDSIFSPGDEIKLKWTVVVEHDPVDWDLYFSVDGGATWEVIEEGIRLEVLDYVWKAPDVESSRMMVQIVQDNDIMDDYSDFSDTFTITSEQLTPVLDHTESTFRLSAYPVPAIEVLNIHFVLKEQSAVQLEMIDVSGLAVDQVIRQGILPAGEHRLQHEIGKFPHGLYLLRIEIDGLSFSRPVFLH